MAITLDTTTRTAGDLMPGSVVVAPAGSSTQTHVVLMTRWVPWVPPHSDAYWSLHCLGLNGASFEWRVDDDYEFEVIV